MNQQPDKITALYCRLSQDDTQDRFVCFNYKSNTGSCQIHYIREVTLYKRMLECIQRTLTYVRLLRDDFMQEMLAQAEFAQTQKALSAAQKRMEDLDRIIQRLYEDAVLGKLSDARFVKLSTQYEMEQAKTRQLSLALEQELAEESGQIAMWDASCILRKSIRNYRNLMLKRSMS